MLNADLVLYLHVYYMYVDCKAIMWFWHLVLHDECCNSQVRALKALRIIFEYSAQNISIWYKSGSIKRNRWLLSGQITSHSKLHHTVSLYFALTKEETRYFS